MRTIAEMVCLERLEEHDIPDLLVVSDMQFDQARFDGGYGGWNYGAQSYAPSPGWDTAYEEIAHLFHEVGMQVHGRPLSPPNIIFWNVRADTYGYPAAADQKGVMLLGHISRRGAAEPCRADMSALDTFHAIMKDYQCMLITYSCSFLPFSPPLFLPIDQSSNF